MKSFAIVMITIGLVCSTLGGYWIYSDYFSRFEDRNLASVSTPDKSSLPELEFDGIHPVRISHGGLSVSVDAVKINDGTRAVSVIGSVGGKTVFSMGFDRAQEPRANVGFVWLNRTAEFPQVVLTQFSGGAHCCTLTKIATIDKGSWWVVDGGSLDGGFGYQYQDLNNDRESELISLDNSFLYAFECYACSYAPTRIKKLVGAEIKDVTTDQQYRDFLREKLRQMESNAHTNASLLQSNGYLGGWVAAKALVGEFEDAWRTMLANYNRASDWVMEECLVAVPLNRCPSASKRRIDFPDALLKNLIDNGYISAKEKIRLSPKPGLDNRYPAATAPPAGPQPAVTLPQAQPSFDCWKAKTDVEGIICSNKPLADVDAKMGAAFRAKLSQQTGNKRAEFIQSQRDWLVSRDARCSSGINVDLKVGCLNELTAARIIAFQSDGAEQSLPEPQTYYVANTSPPDAFLSLRTLPSTGAGSRIIAMPNGTVLQVLERSSDGWWRVRTSHGVEGWALSRDYSGKPWIVKGKPASESIIGEPGVISTSTIVINGESIALQGVGGLAGEYADRFRAFLREQGGRVTCDVTPDQTYRCKTASNTDLSAAVIFNGSGRALADAPDDLKRAEQSARQRKSGLWSAAQ